jgi:hypothetical protein
MTSIGKELDVIPPFQQWQRQKVEKLIFASATSNAHPLTTLIEGNLKGEERLQLQNYLKIITDSNIIPNMLLTPIMET